MESIKATPEIIKISKEDVMEKIIIPEKCKKCIEEGMKEFTRRGFDGNCSSCSEKR